MAHGKARFHEAMAVPTHFSSPIHAKFPVQSQLEREAGPWKPNNKACLPDDRQCKGRFTWERGAALLRPAVPQLLHLSLCARASCGTAVPCRCIRHKSLLSLHAKTFTGSTSNRLRTDENHTWRHVAHIFEPCMINFFTTDEAHSWQHVPSLPKELELNFTLCFHMSPSTSNADLLQPLAKLVCLAA